MSLLNLCVINTDLPSFRLGYAEGEGVMNEMGSRSPKDFDGCLIYGNLDLPDDGTSATKIERAGNPTQLKTISTMLATELYKRGILT